MSYLLHHYTEKQGLKYIKGTKTKAYISNKEIEAEKSNYWAQVCMRIHKLAYAG